MVVLTRCGRHTDIRALTAWQGLIERAALAPGERILIHGAAGDVGAFTVAITARARIMIVYATAATASGI